MLRSELMMKTVSDCAMLLRGGDYDLLKTLSTLSAIEKVRQDGLKFDGPSGKARAGWLERMQNVHGQDLEGDMQVGASER